ncbi:YraN family protein [Inconstantimicrobium mannanitabidum]|uniref:UPF0102 protein n=1 Tax=Inconstantimicrobium mannanitabidum TaxID=1604901 RepID=A0ACB5RAS6_9CLOT|nr:YraN family protein [Clostridium sp. TW13]GKX66292.1 UPF0102 protein [Clostridium sp. TW13]
MKKYNKDIGNEGEFLAKEFLCKKGYNIKESNYRCPLGEIDIILSKDNILCFVEVKSRYNLNYGYPMEAVTHKKLNRIYKICNWYLLENKINNLNIRFDVVEIIFSINDNSYKINHLENVYSI